MDNNLTKKQILRERSLARLTEAAFHLFVLKGYHATSVEAISTEANLTKGAVYFYFGSKENLVLHLFSVLKAGIVDALVAAILKGGGSATDRIIRYIHCGADYGEKRPDELLFMIQMSIEFGGQDDNAIAGGINELYTRVYDALEQVVSDGLEQGTLPAQLKAWELASMIVAVHDGMMLEWHRRGRVISGPELVRHVRHMVLSGISTSEVA